ncbi:hypothetical protein [Agrobacterium sp. NPDC090283]|uniref:hypothetical protein n=1 Tax=Agrobacterium sp. NPDC090283 TaxID=3363920 RepID=UPI003839F19D
MVKRYTWIVLTNAVERTDEEFNRWYDTVHVPDLLKIPGVVGAERSKLAPYQSVMTDQGIEIVDAGNAPISHRYLALYHIETDDLPRVLNEVRTRAGTPEMIISETLLEASTMCFEAF